VLALLASLSGCTDKKTLTPFVIPQTPTSPITGVTPIYYAVYDRPDTFVYTAFEFSTDGGFSYAQATPASGPVNGIAPAHPFGYPNVFYWDSFRDLGPGYFPAVVLRASGEGLGAIGRAAVTLSFIADESGSFTQAATLGGTARSNVVAAPLPDGSVFVGGGTVNGSPTTLVEVFDPVLEQIVSTSALTEARTAIAGALLASGRVLTVGGADVTSSAVATAEYFSKATGMTRAVPAGLVVPRYFAAVGPLPDGTAVVAGGIGPGGVPTPSVELYDPTAGPDGAFAIVATTTLAAVSQPTATALADGRVLFAGGADQNGTAVGTAFVFDPATRTIVTVANSMTQARVGHRATRLSSGKVLLAGGFFAVGNAATALSSAELFDPTTLAFTGTGSLNVARGYQGQDLAGGSVVAVGGAGLPLSPETAEVFSQDTGTWTILDNFRPVASRSEASAVAYGPGRALVAGGGASPELYHCAVSPIPEAWIPVRAPAPARAYHTATRYGNNDILLVGGTTGVVSATSSVQIFHGTSSVGVTALTFEDKAPLLTARSAHTATLTLQGIVLVTGGRDVSGNVLGSIEGYNIVINEWTAFPGSLAVPRADHHAVALLGGDVLILGGRDASGKPVGLAEIIHPGETTIESSSTENFPRVDDDVIFDGDARVLIAGGSDAAGNPVQQLEIYQPLQRTFTVGGNLLVARPGLALAPSLVDLHVIAVGGGDPARADFEGIDASQNLPEPEFPSTLVPLETARSFERATQIADGVVLFSGGRNAGLVLDASGYYVPLNTSFGGILTLANQANTRATLGPHMTSPRLGHTATLLANGEVFVAGGVDGRGVVVPGAEIFHP
jgi:hypothetical protein